MPPMPPPTPASPAPPKPEPWWLTAARTPPRPKHASSAAALRTVGLANASSARTVEVLDPRPGTVLLAADGAFEGSAQPYFANAVVLLVKLCSCHPSIFGILLSAPPSNHSVGEAMCPVAQRRYHSFITRPVHHGGPAGPHWTVVHDAPLAGSLQLAPNLHVGGCLGDAQARVDAGSLRADAISFYSGYAAWPIARLADEVAAGTWHVAVAPSDHLLHHARKGTLSAARLRDNMI